MMPSFSSCSSHNQQPSPCAKQRSLQLQHKQLDQSLRDKIQSLNLQINVHRSQINNVANDPTITIIQQFLRKQTQVQQIFTQSLVKKQILIQEEKQMKEIIKSYQKRIWDLRSILINKQAEISAACFQFSRDSVPKKQNLQSVNNSTIQKSTISKYSKQRKKLLVQIQALQYTLKGLQDKNVKFNHKNKQRQNIHFQSFPAQEDGKNNNSSKPIFPNNSAPKDLLFEKVLNLLQVEINKQNNQRQLCQQFKQQLQCSRQNIGNLKNDYKITQSQKSKSHLKYNRRCSQDNNQQSQNKFSFIAELNQQLKKTQSTSNGHSKVLFSQIDMNQEKLYRLRSTTPKGRTTALRQRKGQTYKQN